MKCHCIQEQQPKTERVMRIRIRLGLMFIALVRVLALHWTSWRADALFLARSTQGDVWLFRRSGIR